MTKPERYQMGFDFGRRRPSIEYDMSSKWYNEDGQFEGTSRFTRTLRETVSIRTPTDAAHHLLTQIYTPFEAFPQEELWGLLLNTKNRITHEVMIYRGTINTVHLRQAEVFREAIRFNARGLLLSHSHPSGDPSPSPVIWRICQIS
jgi:DNA repair protein RadC